MRPSHLSIWLTTTSLVKAAGDCNPLTQSSCDPIPGLASSSYSIDFTNQESLPSDWVLADASNVTFSDKGAQFNFNKRKDAPYIWTNFYVAYGKIDVELQVADGTGVITSAVMFSDDADEIDWEFSGSNFGAGVSSGKAQTNVFAKGIPGSYDRGTQQDLSPPPQSSFHTYSINWTPDKIDWIIDGVTKYSTTNNGQTTGNYQFPQTPSRLHIGIWDAGDPDTAPGTRNWAGGYTDYTKLPYVAFVRSVKISTPNPCKSWQYPADFSGSWKDVKCTNQTVTSASSASKTSTTTRSTYTASTYTVINNDNGWAIADKLGCTFDQLSAANLGVDWNNLSVGQTLYNPNAAVPETGAPPSSATSSTTTSISSSNKSPDSSSQKITSGSQTSSGTTSSGSLADSIVPVTASGSSGSSTIVNTRLSTSSTTSTVVVITQKSTKDTAAITTTTTTTTVTAASTKKSVDGSITTTSTSTTNTKPATTRSTTKSYPSPSSRISSIKTTSSSSGGSWGNWAGNYAGSSSSSKQNSGGPNWAFWKRNEDKHRKNNNFQFGRFGGGHQHV